MTDKEALTLEQLAQIALGSNKLDSLHISLLHTIINLTLKKLNCENEKVTLNGLPADNLRKLLQQSTTGPALSIDEQNVKVPMKKYEKITQLEEKTKRLESQLDEHLAERHFSLTSDPVCLTEFEVEESSDEIINGLRHNKWFLTQLNRRLTTPFICRLRTLELSLNKLKDRIEVFKKECASAYEDMNKVADLQENLAVLRKSVDKSRSDFKSTMNEIQGILNSKVDNCEMLKVKAEFKDIINNITLLSKDVQQKKATPQALSFYSAITPENKVIPDQRNQPEQLSLISAKNDCDCDYVSISNHISLPEIVENISLNQILWQERETTCRFSLEK